MPFILDLVPSPPSKTAILTSSFYNDLGAFISQSTARSGIIEISSPSDGYINTQSTCEMGGGNNGGSSSNTNTTSSSTSVSQALEIARDSEEGARDPVVVAILENALARIWGKVQAQPNTYVMTRDEFAIFNYFQSRFVGNTLAIEARKRYWDHFRGANGGS